MKRCITNVGLVCLLLMPTLSCQQQEPIGLNIIRKYLNDDVYVGQTLSTLKRNRNLSDNDSVSGSSEKIDNNAFFDIVYYNADKNHRYFDLRATLEYISLQRFRTQADSTDSLQLQIIQSCIEEFGEEFKIYRTSQQYYFIVLVWSLEKVCVKFSYMPFEIYRPSLQNVLYRENGYELDISRDCPDRIIDLEESNEWTKTYFLNKTKTNSE